MSEKVPEITVVVGAKNPGPGIRRCLEAIRKQSAGMAVEIVVADASTDGTAEIVLGSFPEVTLMRADPQLLMPQLWSLGIERARAPLVAITIGQCVPGPGWIDGILKAASTQERCAGFGGSIAGPRGGRLRDWALYFSRYSAYMPPVEARLTSDIAGDNAAYRRAALQECRAEISQGFWENLIHHRLRSRGWDLWLSPEIQVELGPAGNAGQFCRERFRHGRHYGSTRPGNSRATRAGRVLTAPALIPFLALRIGRRVARQRPDWLATYVFSLAWLLLFLSFWSLGEASGYLCPERGRPGAAAPETRARAND